MKFFAACSYLFVGAIVVGCSSAPSSDASEDEGALKTQNASLTVENYARHATLDPIRQLVRDIDTARNVTEHDKPIRCEMGEIGRAKLVDATGIRKLSTWGGSDDSAYDTSLYYERGVLRFAYRHMSSVHKTEREDRRYFDEDGTELIWVVREAFGDDQNEADIAKGTDRLGYDADLFELSEDVRRAPDRAYDAAADCF